MFLRANYTYITQNTYIKIPLVTEILAREKCLGLWCLHTVVRSWRDLSYALVLQRANQYPCGVRENQLIAFEVLICVLFLWWRDSDLINFEVLKRLFSLPTLNIAIRIMFTDIAMVMQVLPWTNTDAVTPKGEFRLHAY